MTNDKEKEYKILINKKGVPVLIPSSDNSDPDTWFDLADESKYIAFKDESLVIRELFHNLSDGSDNLRQWIEDKAGQTFDLPETISVSFECPYCDCINNNFICNRQDKKVATLTPLLDKEEPQQYKTVSVGEIFSVEGKYYVFLNPETADQKPTTDHGHILHEVNFVTH